MKKSELLIIIEYIVDKKIKQIINNNIDEIIDKRIDKKMKLVLKENTSILTKNNNNNLQVKGDINFSKNKLINDILNDTVKNNYFDNNIKTINENIITNNNSLNEVFTKNYSDVLKKMEEKSKSIRNQPNSYINKI